MVILRKETWNRGLKNKGGRGGGGEGQGETETERNEEAGRPRV